MKEVIRRIERLMAELAKSPKENRLHAIGIWEAYRKEVFQKPPTAEEVVAAIDWMVFNQEWKYGEPLLLAASASMDPRVAFKVCAIVELGHPDSPIENAIEFLADLRLPESIPALIRAVEFRFDFDTSLQIPIKALQALREIGDLRAVAYLRRISTSDNEVLSGFASELLSDFSADF